MKLVADESIESEIVTALESAGHEIIDIKRTRPGISDQDVLSLAADENAVLITNDKDFGELVYRDRAFSTGIVLVRCVALTVRQRSQLLVRVIDENKDRLPRSFTVLTPGGLRVRT